MVGNRVKIITAPLSAAILSGSITGTLQRLTAEGATIWRENSMPDQSGNVFVPMHRIVEILDLGRAS